MIFGEYSDIVENDILTMQRFLDISRFLYSGGWQVCSWRLHESEIQVQGNQRFFFLAASRLVFAASLLSHSSSSHAEKNQEKPLGPGYKSRYSKQNNDHMVELSYVTLLTDHIVRKI